ncbi:VTT domain-containing protein [Pseudonocardia sp. RS11V-5]|uniref:DedA family protein n=1 Tax=Pseudonocardia terrae TaxID=2905831 RepID=UPI001E599B8E|nr:VTT domain-containing protein [Pseudonocardia terrae]MCE3550506.1 VTT domain-containing protein [Pseudonocardia terrae]
MPLPVAPLAAYLFLLFWSAVPFAPAEPVLLAGGAFAGAGGLLLPFAILAATTGSVASDLAKYALGRAAGPALLRRIARRRAGARAVTWIESRLAASGPMVIAPSYFVPFGVVASTIACGALRMRLRGVVLGSAVGALIWATVCLGLGFLGATVTGDPWFGFALAVPAAVVVGLLARRRVAPERAGQPDACACEPTPLRREPEHHEGPCPLAA